MSNSESIQDEDGILLAAVAERQDRVAFSELMDRHQKTLFNLTNYLSQNREHAEDALQEAMLRVWSNAHRFEYRGRGSVRAWLLRLTAHATIQLGRRSSREAKRIARKKEFHDPKRETMSARKNMEQGELQHALREKLDELGSDERQLVGLYFGANMDQQSIATHLKLSQQAVSHRLKRVLETLRTSLAGSGFSAVLPLLDSADLGGVLYEGVDVPSGLLERVSESLSVSSDASRSSQVSAKGAKGWQTPAYLATIIVVGGIVAIAWQGSTSKEPLSMTSPEITSPVTGLRSARPTEVGDGSKSTFFHRRWNFNDAEQMKSAFLPTERFEYVSGDDSQGGGCVRSTTSRLEIWFKEVPLHALPLRVRLKRKMIKPHRGMRTGNLSVAWSAGSMNVAGHFLNAGVLPSNPTPRWQQVDCYLSRHFNDLWIDGTRTNIMYVNLNEKRNLGLGGYGVWLIDDLEIEQVSKESIPDVAPFLASVEAIPQADRRKGTYEVAEITSMRPGKNVFLRFDSCPILSKTTPSPPKGIEK